MTVAIPATAPALPAAVVRARELYVAGIDPTDVPCVCGFLHSVHAGPTHAGAGPDGCRRYRADQVAQLAADAKLAQEYGFEETMAAYDKATRKPRKGPREVNVRPSDAGACPRSVQYREAPPADYTPLPSPKRQAYMGTLIDEAFLARRKRLFPWRFYQLELTLPGMPRAGRLDEYDPITGRLISLKTAGSWRWDETGQHGPDEKWWDQDHAYAWCLEALGYPVEVIEVLVIEREAGNDETHEMPYDRERGRRVVERLVNMRRLLTEGKDLPRTEGGPTNSKLCSTYCPARAHCWNIPMAEALGVTPENYTILGMTPEDERVESVIEELIGLQELAKPISEAIDELKAILKGVDLRIYGEYEPVEGKSTSTAWSDYRKAVEDVFSLPAWDRPAEPPKPRQSQKVYYTWKRLRASTRKRLEKERLEAQALLEASQEALEAPEGTEPTPPTLTVVSKRLDSPEPLALPSAEAS